MPHSTQRAVWRARSGLASKAFQKLAGNYSQLQRCRGVLAKTEPYASASASSWVARIVSSSLPCEISLSHADAFGRRSLEAAHALSIERPAIVCCFRSAILPTRET